MSEALNDAALRQLFLDARTFNKFQPRPVDDATLRRLVDLAKWGPTSMNAQPGRFVFVRSAEAKEKLKPALMPGNRDKTMAAPVTVIVAHDVAFHEHLPTQFPAMPGARDMFAGSDAMRESTAFRNGSLQGAYLILAARALGLDAGPMSGFDPAAVDAAFFPDGRWKSNFLVNLGYGDPAGNHPRGPRLPFETVARID
ncbi:MAG TPA: malonic semialdehyde reductase [Burkholderiaceae bacterium]